MLWRARTTLADRPGTLADLTRLCGEQGVNILALQIFPGLDRVTDELVLRTPEDWDAARVADLVLRAGGTAVAVGACNDHALADGPIHYLHALRRVADDPATLAEMLARVLDAEVVDPDAVARAPGPADDPTRDGGSGEPADPDTLTVDVGPQRVVLHRAQPFTATEHARAVAFADVAAELLPTAVGLDPLGPAVGGAEPSAPAPGPPSAPEVRVAGFDDTAALMRMHLRCSADSVYRRYASPLARIDDRFARRLLLAGGGALVAAVGHEVVGVASLSTCEAGVVEVALLVEDGWQRRGLGTWLLSRAARHARGQGAVDVVLRSRTHNPALMSLAFASGLRARIRLDGDTVVVTVGVEGLKPPAPAVPAPAGPTRGLVAPA